MNDNYTHVDTTLLYVIENIPGPEENSHEYAELLESFNSQLTGCCNCEQCNTECPCKLRSGGCNYITYSINKTIMHKLSQKDFKKYPLLECNNMCKCTDSCNNRLVQKGPIDGLYVAKCETKGMGLFTKQFIPNGTFICEYAGEVITESQAIKRHMQNRTQQKMNYIYCLKEYCNDKVTKTFIDPSTFGNIGRYINHSCEPNCQIIPVRIDTAVPKLAIFTCTDIKSNEEITFDYSPMNTNNYDLIALSRTEGVDDRKKCLCGSLRCRGSMPYDVY